MKNRPIKSIALSLSITAIIVTAPFVKADPAITVEIASIDTLIIKLTNIAQQLAPQVPSAMLPSVLGMAIKNPGLVGIERTKPVQLQVFLADIDENAKKQSSADLEPTIALHVPVLDNGKHYLALLEQSMAKPILKNGIMVFTPTTGAALYIKIDDDYAIISDKEIAVKSSKGVSSDALLDIDGTIRIGIAPQKFIPYITFGAKQAETTMSQQPTVPGMQIDTGKVLKSELNALTAILKQVDATAFGIKINKSTIDINSRINPVKDSTIAKLNKSLTVPSAKYASLAPANALYAASGTGMDSLDLVIEPYGKLISEIYTAMGPDFSKIGPSINKMLKDYKGLYSGEYAMGVVNVDNEIGFYEVIALKDVVKTKKIMDESINSYNDTFGDVLKGVTISTGSDRTYKKVTIKTITYHVDKAAMTTPMPGMEILEKMKYEIAYIKNNMLYTIGNQNVMNQLIDRIYSKTIKAPSAQFTKLIPGLKDKPVCFYTLSIAEIIKTVLLMTPDVNETMLTGSSTGNGIAGYATVNDGDIIGLDRISINELIAIRDLAPIIQSTVTKMIMAPQMQTQSPSSPPAPPATPTK